MNSDIAMTMASNMLWVAAFVAAPILGVALAVGLIISIFQVATQIQEMTLTFVPKIIAVFGVLIVFGHWMLVHIAEYATELIRNIPTYF